MSTRVHQLIAELDLQPHPEGGMFREVYRSRMPVLRPDGATRPALTTIFFLLPAGAVSRWHRVAADEVWHYYEGADLELNVLCPGDSAPQPWRLGRVDGATLPVRIVPAGAWQSARSLGEYTLVGCTVAPGFEFADFLMLEDAAPAERPAVLGGE